MSGEILWQFKTRNFTVQWLVSPCYELDLSWDESGEAAENIESGFWEAFDSEMRVLFRGAEVGAAYLGQSIYKDVSDFRDHIGMNARGHGSYFSDMVREAVAEARIALANMPELRVRDT